MPSTAKKSQNLTFLSGFVQSRDITRVIAQVDELAKQGAAYSWVMKRTSDSKQWSAFELHWIATRMWVDMSRGVTVFVTGPAGVVCVATPGAAVEERMDESLDGPQGRGPIRDLRGIGDHLYACGMARQVYRREATGQWSHRDEGVVLPKGTLIVAGFNSMDGLSEDTFYAVGYGGEIWRCWHSNWQQMDSPTNVVLHRVRVIKNDLMFAAGQRGVLLRGNGDMWEQVSHERTKDDFWGMEWFNGRLYVASDKAIYFLTNNGDLEQVNLRGINTCGHLHANDRIMWSFGTKQLAWTEDGAEWNDGTP
jgi:hypothetical protein